MRIIQVEKTASRGIAIAKAYIFSEPVLSPEGGAILESEAEAEFDKFIAARAAVVSELSVLSEHSDIFMAHLEIANDFMLEDGVREKIISERMNVQTALSEVVETISQMFLVMEDEYMRERAADVKDIGKRLMAKIKGVILPDLGSIDSEVIVVARDLYPSDTIKLNADYVKGIVTKEGGVTSHVCIVAKGLGIPILVGVTDVLSKAEEGMTLCMDAWKGTLAIDPDQETLERYQSEQRKFEAMKEELRELRNIAAVTKSGKRIRLCANVQNLDEVKNACEYHADGIGLFRSEFLYMENTHFPTEEEQYEVYAEAAKLCPEELTIRTLDIGGDKALPYFEFEHEENPFLGWRAIRISLEMKDMFKQQLRAILRASAYGNVRIMFPMIISLEELREAKQLVEECKIELRSQSIDFDEHIKMGMMIETPSSVLLASEFAKESDFFSIGTNDLTQYILAVDRGNKKIATRYSYFHPAVLNAIEQVIKAGHENHITVGMCGEMAGDTNATALLLGYGLDEFSMSGTNIDYVREKIIKWEE